MEEIVKYAVKGIVLSVGFYVFGIIIHFIWHPALGLLAMLGGIGLLLVTKVGLKERYG